MTREEAIKVLKEYLALDKDIDSEYLVVTAKPKMGRDVEQRKRRGREDERG